jgi:hypothetical protein
MNDANRTALLLLVEALLTARDRKNCLFEDAVRALLSMVNRDKVLTSAELETLLSSILRQRLLSKDEIVEAVEGARQALLPDRPHQAELLHDLRRKIINLT